MGAPGTGNAAAWLDLVLPCLDEAAALPTVLGTVPDSVRAIVVDNGSTDGSGPLAASLGATVVTAPVRGYGAACAAGLAVATAPVVAFCDCDASVDPVDVVRAAELVAAGEADLVTGRRRPVGAGAWPVHARAAVVPLVWAIRRRTGVRLHDLGPVRVARTEALRALGVADRGSGLPVETVLRAAAAGWRIVEADVRYTPRVGRSKVTGTARGTLRAVHAMAGLLSRPLPDVLSAPGAAAVSGAAVPDGSRP